MQHTADRFAACADAVMTERGAFMPWDPLLDGPSAHGVGLGLLSVWIGGPADLPALHALPREEAARILHRMVWGPVGAGQLGAGPDLALFAYAVEAGTVRAMADLQDLLGVAPSGAPDAATLRAAATWDAETLAARIGARHAAWRRAMTPPGRPPPAPAARRRPAEAGA